MTDKIKDIITRSVNAQGEIHYTLDEQLFLISEYIKEKKGVYPPSPIKPNGSMRQDMMLVSFFNTSIEYFCNKLNYGN